MTVATPRRLMLLVDWDNLDGRRGISDQETKYRVYLPQALVTVLGAFQADEVRVRLYGGWVTEGNLSQAGNQVAAVEAGQPLLPARHPLARGLLRGSVELARSPLSHPDFEPTTYERLAGPSRVRLSRADEFQELCAMDRDSCPAQLAKKFTKSRFAICPAETCEVSAQHAFVRSRQKMVDSMITSDAIAASLEKDHAVAVVSCDPDMVPGCLTAARITHSEVILIQPWNALRDEYVKALEDCGVTCLSLGLEST